MNMKVFTLEQAQNMGAFLQAFSMQEILRAEGHTVSFARLGTGGGGTKADKVKKICHAFLQGGIPYVLFKYRAAKRYAAVAARLNRDPAVFDPRERFDVAVIGSDEVWNVGSTRFRHYPQYFAHEMNAGRRVAYAACSGNTTPETAGADAIDLSEFTAVSVRDDKTSELVRALTGNTPLKVCDPTLLIPSLTPYIKPVDETGYILVYSYGLDKKEVASVRHLAKVMGKKLVSVATYNAWCDRNVVCDPFEFLGWLAGADFVITSTFHGTALSMKLGKQFAVFPKSSQKLWGLLRDYSLVSRVVTDQQTPVDLWRKQIDYQTINEGLERIRKASLSYLHDAIGGGTDDSSESV